MLAAPDEGDRHDPPPRRGAHMNDAFVSDAVRTPFGRFGGALATTRPDDLAALVVRAVVDRAPGRAGDGAGEHVDEVVFGNATVTKSPTPTPRDCRSRAKRSPSRFSSPRETVRPPHVTAGKSGSAAARPDNR